MGARCAGGRANGHEEPSLLAAEVEQVGASDVLLLSGRSLESLYPKPLSGWNDWVWVSTGAQSIRHPAGTAERPPDRGMPVVALRAHALPVCRLRFKRLLDLLYLLLLTVPAVFLAAAIALWVRLRAGSGVIYRQKRVGLDGREFVMLKFRTMTRAAEPGGKPVLASQDDPRVLPGLGWLRRTRLDELPQLWNVLGGSMSIVGPRPERPELVEKLSQEIGGYSRRHDVPPGITGLAQIQGYYQTDAAYKLGHDLQYIVNWSPVLDMLIMLKSLVVMARRSAC